MKGGNAPRLYGLRKERDAQKLLSKLGYEVVRAAGSHTLFDLVAVPRQAGGIVRLIQLKAGGSALPKQDAEDMAACAGPGRSIEVWSWPKYFRSPVISEYNATLGAWNYSPSGDPKQIENLLLPLPSSVCECGNEDTAAGVH